MAKLTIVFITVLTLLILGCSSDKKNYAADFKLSVDSLINSSSEFKSLQYEIIPSDDLQKPEDRRFSLKLKGSIKDAETYDKLLAAIRTRHLISGLQVDSLIIKTECDSQVGVYKGTKKDFMGPVINAEIKVSKSLDGFTVILTREIKQEFEGTKTMTALFDGACNGNVISCRLKDGLWHQESLDLTMTDTEIHFGNTTFYK